MTPPCSWSWEEMDLMRCWNVLGSTWERVKGSHEETSGDMVWNKNNEGNFAIHIRVPQGYSPLFLKSSLCWNPLLNFHLSANSYPPPPPLLQSNSIQNYPFFNLFQLLFVISEWFVWNLIDFLTILVEYCYFLNLYGRYVLQYELFLPIFSFLNR